MHKWRAQAWTEHGPAADEQTVTAETLAEAAAKIAAELDHLELAELNIWRDDR